MKTKTLLLQGPIRVIGSDKAGEPTHYRVIKMKNSTRFKPQQIITKAETDDLCEAADWDVTIEEKRS